MDIQSFDRDKLTIIIEGCLKQVPKAEWKHLPKVLLEKGCTRFLVLATPEFIIIDFLDEEEKRISTLNEKKLPSPPFSLSLSALSSNP
jgi:hypothetical protein